MATMMKGEGGRSLLSLRQWIITCDDSRESVLRKTAVARGIALILRHIARTGIGRYGQNDKHVDPIFAALHQHVLGVKSNTLSDDTHVDNFTLEIIDGCPVVLSCVSPSVNLALEAGDTENVLPPRHESLETWVIDSRTNPTDAGHLPTAGMSNEESDALLTKLGDLLYKLYSGNPNLCATTAKEVNPIAFQRLNVDDDLVDGQPRQKRRSKAEISPGRFGERHSQLKELGVPDAAARLVKDLLEIGLGDFRPDTSVTSIEEVCGELELLLDKPDDFMFPSPLVEQPRLEIDTTVLYGREDEMCRLLSAHGRLKETGKSEAVLIQGYSGCGKTSLVSSVIPHVERAGGYFIGQKFDDLTSSPVALMLNAFDMLPPLVLKNCNPCEVEIIKRDLCNIFGDQLATLVQLLPNAALLRMSPQSSTPSQPGSNLRIEYTLQLFARIISSRSRPIVLHLDDIQHADEYSLDLLLHILGDIRGYSSILFIGSFRSNELGDEHPVYGFMSNLERNWMLTSNIHLGGIELENVNALVSNSLRLVPRYCKDLSREIYRKTDGNPLFVIETLRSFAERGLIEYRLRRHRWCWDIDQIGDVKLSDNVSDLITLKIAALPEKNQHALKALSCFGTSANHDILNTLSLSMELENLQLGCPDELVNAGLLNKNDAGYNFSHDKVLEAAVSLFATDYERADCHRRIGMILLDAFDKGNLDCVEIVADQCNRGTIEAHVAYTSMARLNEKAAASALKRDNRKSALQYSSNAMRHLPENCWQSERDLSIRVHLTHAKSAAINDDVEEAKNTIDELLPFASAIDKMAALSLKGSILGKSRQLQEALATVVGALSDLGETIPQTFDDETLERLFAHTLQSVRESSISEVQEFKLASPDDAAVPINRFYDLAVKLSHLLDPNMLEIFACKSVIASMRFGWTKFSCFGLAVFAARVQVRGMFDEGFAIGSSALKALDLFSDAEDQKTFVYFGYYGEIASFHIPLQLCCEMLNHGKEIGLLHGKHVGAIWNGNYFLHKGLLAAIELSKLQEECKYQVGIVEGDRDQYFGMLAAHMNLLKNTIDILTGDEPFSGPVDGDGPSPGTTVMRYEFLKKYHHSLRAFWTRNFGQCVWCTNWMMGMQRKLPNAPIMIKFFGGLAGYCSPDGKPDDSLVDAAIATLREKEATCAHNFRNKRLLLEAEKFSHAGEMEEADVAYLSAIEAAREARFVHEQGLACELAAAHYSRNGSEDDRCRSLLRQALECYETWGCKPRVEYIAKMIAEL